MAYACCNPKTFLASHTYDPASSGWISTTFSALVSNTKARNLGSGELSSFLQMIVGFGVPRASHSNTAEAFCDTVTLSGERVMTGGSNINKIIVSRVSKK